MYNTIPSFDANLARGQQTVQKLKSKMAEW